MIETSKRGTGPFRKALFLLVSMFPPASNANAATVTQAGMKEAVSLLKDSFHLPSGSEGDGLSQ